MKTTLLLTAAFTLLGAASSLDAATLTINPTVSGQIRSSSTGTNPISIAERVTFGHTGASSDNNTLHALLSFNLDQAELVGATITSVTLVLTAAADVQSEHNSVVQFQLYTLQQPISTSTTWSLAAPGTPWETPGATGATDRGALVSSLLLNTLDYTGPTNAGKKITFASSAAFISDVESAIGGTFALWAGLAPEDMTEGERHILQVANIGYGTASYRPQLIISYEPIPEPSAIALVVASLTGVGIFRKKRMKGRA